MTLAQLRALLERALHTDGPTPPHIARLGQSVSVEDLARAYLPRRVYYAVPARPATALCAPTLGYTHHVGIHDAMWPRTEAYPDPLDLTDPGTVSAVRVGLALARGFDPSSGVKWTRNGADNAWILDASDWCAFATSTAARSVTPSRHVIEADLVGNETDSARALVLAAEHVLGASEGR